LRAQFSEPGVKSCRRPEKLGKHETTTTLILLGFLSRFRSSSPSVALRENFCFWIQLQKTWRACCCSKTVGKKQQQPLKLCFQLEDKPRDEYAPEGCTRDSSRFPRVIDILDANMHAWIRRSCPMRAFEKTGRRKKHPVFHAVSLGAPHGFSVVFAQVKQI